MLDVAGWPFIWCSAVLHSHLRTRSGTRRDDEDDDGVDSLLMKIELHRGHGPAWKQMEPGNEDTIEYVKMALQPSSTAFFRATAPLIWWYNAAR